MPSAPPAAGRTDPPLVLVFLKAPRPGSVKTRLARAVGTAEATSIYRRLVERQLAAIPGGWAVEINHAPDDAGPEMRGWLGPGHAYRAQGHGDLGARLARAFDAALRTGPRAVIAIGGDCPDLDAAALQEAARRLQETDVVLGPAKDGGYYLIGMRRCEPRLFANVPWSTPAVLATTLRHCTDSGLACALLEPREDIDDGPGWRRFQARCGVPTDTTVPLAIVMPALNEAERIGRSVDTAKREFPGAPVIVVDGGSADDTSAIATAAGARVVASPRGRGAQCRTGADAVAAEWLLFLHADTLLPENAGEVVRGFIGRPAASIATFRLRFDDDGWFLRACGWFTRFDSVFTRFGDQGILIRSSFYRSLGGFPPWPLFEDVALLQRARQEAKIHSLPAAVTTSARRFRHRGAIRQQWLNARLLLRYLGGTSPETLAAIYRTDPAKMTPSGQAIAAVSEPEGRAR